MHDNKDQSLPLLSVILIALNKFELILKTLQHLSRQDIKHSIEIIIITESGYDFKIDSNLLGLFHSYRVIKLDKLINVGQCLAKGFLIANANIVTYCEEHSFPQKGWATGVIKSHEEDWAAVGWVVKNANPDTVVSWINMFSSFGPFVYPAKSGERNKLATHHISYKKSLIEKYCDNLDELLENELILLMKLKENGYRFYLEARSVSKHVNISNYSLFVYSDYISGRIYSAYRSKYIKMSRFRIFLYVIFSPIRPISKITRVLIHVIRTSKYSIIPWIIPFLILPAFANSMGEMLGYIIGEKDLALKNRYIELDRRNLISSRLDIL